MSRISILFLVLLSVCNNARPLYPNSTSPSITDCNHCAIRALEPLQDERVKFSLGDEEKEYTIVPLSKIDQGKFSRSYDILGGFEGNAAILKKIEHPDQVDTKTRKEIGYLENPVVDLLLHAERIAGDAFYLVIKNVRKGDPPMKPFHEWYIEDESMLAEDSLAIFRDTIRKRLLDYYAKQHNILYHDGHLMNIFVTKSLDKIMPIDWGPPERFYPTDGRRPYTMPGVEDVDPTHKEEDILNFASKLDRILRMDFNVESLDRELTARDQRLRPSDIRVEKFSGREYELLLVHKGEEISTYSLIHGYHGTKPARMKIVTNYSEDEIQQLIWDMKKDGAKLLDDVERAGNIYYFVYTWS